MKSGTNKRKHGSGNRDRTDELSARSGTTKKDSGSESDSAFSQNNVGTGTTVKQETGNTVRMIIITTFVSGIVCTISNVLVPMIFIGEFGAKNPTSFRDTDAFINDELSQSQNLNELENRINKLEAEQTEHLHLQDALKKLDERNEKTRHVIGGLEEQFRGFEDNIVILRDGMQPISESHQQDQLLQANIEVVRNDCSQKIHKIVSDQSEVAESFRRLTAKMDKIEMTTESKINAVVSDIQSQISVAGIKTDSLSSELLQLRNSVKSMEMSLEETAKSLSKPVVIEPQLQDTNQKHIQELRSEMDSIRTSMQELHELSKTSKNENSNIQRKIQQIQTDNRILQELFNRSMNIFQNELNEKYAESSMSRLNLDSKYMDELRKLRNDMSNVENSRDTIKQFLEQHFRSEIDQIEQKMDDFNNVFTSYMEIVKSVNISFDGSTEAKTIISDAGDGHENSRSTIAKTIKAMQNLINKTLADVQTHQKHMEREIDDGKINLIQLKTGLQQFNETFQLCKHSVDRTAHNYTELNIGLIKIDKKIMIIESEGKTQISLLEETIKSDVANLNIEIQNSQSKMEAEHKADYIAIEKERLVAQQECQMISARIQAIQVDVETKTENVANIASTLRRKVDDAFIVLNDRITNSTLDSKTETDILRSSTNTQIHDAKEKMTTLQSEMETRTFKAVKIEREERVIAIEDMKKSISEMSDDITTMNRHLAERVEESHRYCDSKVEACESAQSDINKGMEFGLKNLSTDLIDMNSSRNSDREQIQQHIDFIISKMSRQKKTIFEITNVLVNKEPLILIIIILAIGEVIIIAVLYRMTRKQSGDHWTDSPQDDIKTTLWNSSSDILNQIRPRTPKNDVCIISFYDETKPLHKQLTNTIIGGDVRLQYVNQIQKGIFRHTDILTLPAARLYLVFVDFNERHIILEDPSKGLGDLRLTTVRAAKKIGGDVAVIYIRDSGSRELADGHLFNPELTSVQKHSELSILNSRQRVCSIFDQFTAYQKLHLRTVMLSSIGK